MVIILAPDKFKGSLSAQEVCQAIREGLLEVNKDIEIVFHPMADGGEGTADLLTEFSAGSKVKVRVQDPLFREIDSEYGISADGTTAFIEMAKASGLQLLKLHERNPLITSTIGTGQLIAHALDRNVNRIILGVGGSATNDGGMGLAHALGFRFFSKAGKELNPVGENLVNIDRIEAAQPHPRLRDCELNAIYDVGSPLYGPRGAAYVYARQKGGTDEGIELLDKGLQHLATLIKGQFLRDVNFEGAGAGGGLPAMAAVLFKSSFEQGIDFIVKFTKLEDLVRRASLVITGEGKIDEQTLTGKVVKGVSDLSRNYQKDCIAFAGRCDLTTDRVELLGLTAIFTLMDNGASEMNAVGQAYPLLRQRVIQEMPRWISQLQN